MNYTNIKQSKKLLELGLSPKSADMFYQWIPYGDSGCCMPCWSVGALIKLLPSSIVDKKGVKYIRCSDFAHVEYLAGYWDRGYHYKIFSEFTHNQSLVDVLYKCVKWLLENNYIKN